MNVMRKEKLMKKLISFLILFAVLFTTITSCSSDQYTDTAEEVIISSIEEGLFYFLKNLDEQELMRKEAITFFNERLKILYNRSISFQSQLNQLNEKILLAETDLVLADYEQLIKNQLAYQVKTNALIESINTYYKIAEENIDEENLFKRKAMDDLIELINLQEEYLSFSIGSLEIIGTGMKEEKSIVFLIQLLIFSMNPLIKAILI
jgi:hypothetical protein